MTHFPENCERERKEDTHPHRAKRSHCFCCLLNTFNDPFGSPERGKHQDVSHPLWALSTVSATDCGGMGGCWPEQLGGRNAPGKCLCVRFMSPGGQAPFFSLALAYNQHLGNGGHLPVPRFCGGEETQYTASSYVNTSSSQGYDQKQHNLRTMHASNEGSLRASPQHRSPRSTTSSCFSI